MKRNAFIMKLKPGNELEYEKRHQNVYPELLKLLSESGIRNYTIFLDKPTLQLFAYQELEDDYDESTILSDPIVWKWWNYMADIMEVNEDQSPVTISLNEVFHVD